MTSYLLVSGDFVQTGGMDRANFYLAHYLARQGYTVHLVAHRVSPALLSYTNVIFHRVPKPFDSYLFASSLLDYIGCYWAKKLVQQEIRVIVNGGNCRWGDVNWVHYVHAAYEPTRNLGILRRLKGVITHQSFLRAEIDCLHRARLILSNSQVTKKHLVKHLGLKVDKINCVYLGVDPAIFYPADPTERVQLRQKLNWDQEKNIAVFIGALGDRRKGFDTLFQAWQSLCANSEWDVKLVVIGQGAELPLWQKRTITAGLESRIQFLGFRSDVPDMLRAADCLISPTRYEAYGLGVHEALCCGLPALVSATAGVVERYPDSLQDLLLPDPNNADDLVHRLKHWRSNQEHYQQLVLPLAQQLRSYTWDDMAQQILNVIG